MGWLDVNWFVGLFVGSLVYVLVFTICFFYYLGKLKLVAEKEISVEEAIQIEEISPTKIELVKEQGYVEPPKIEKFF